MNLREGVVGYPAACLPRVVSASAETTDGRQALDAASGTSCRFGDSHRPAQSPRASRERRVGFGRPSIARLHFGGGWLARQESVPHFGAGPPQSAAKTDAADQPSGRTVSQRWLRPTPTLRPTPATGDLVNSKEGLELAPSPISGSTENLSGGRLFGVAHTESQSMCQLRSTPPTLTALCPAHSADNRGTSTGSRRLAAAVILCSGTQGHGWLSTSCLQDRDETDCRKTPRPTPVSTRVKRRRGWT